MADEENGRPWWERLPAEPVDSLEQLKRFNVPPGRVASCSQPDGNSNAGCACWDDCRLPFKGTRPHNGGIEITKPTSSGVRIRVTSGTCFQFNLKRKAIEDMGGVVEWIADEGETISADGTNFQKKQTPEGRPIEYEHVQGQYPEVIKPFVTLEQRPEVRGALKLEQKRAENIIRRESERRAKLYGASDAEEGERVTSGAEEGSGGAGIQPAKPAGGGKKPA